MDRREFLRRLGIGAASAVVASQALPEAEAQVEEVVAIQPPIAYGITRFGASLSTPDGRIFISRNMTDERPTWTEVKR